MALIDVKFDLEDKPAFYRSIDTVLSHQPDIFYYQDALCRVTSEGEVYPFTVNSLCARLDHHLRWFKMIPLKDGGFAQKIFEVPDKYFRQYLEKDFTDSSVKKLKRITNTIVIRPDGSIANKKGYDPATGVYLTKDWDIVDVDNATAVSHILELIEHFPFENDQARSAAVAMLITPFAQDLYEGPTPLFLVDASKRGSGKTLLATTLLTIANGGAPPFISTWPKNEEEQQKVLASHAHAGNRRILFDNVTGEFGGEALNAVLTSSDNFSYRILGQSNIRKAKDWRPIIAATANNCDPGDDMGRRTTYIRLAPEVECPEERAGLPNMREILDRDMDLYLACAVALVRNWILAGKPKFDSQLGSFEGWSSVVRACLVHAGLPDPYVRQPHRENEEGRTLLRAIREITRKKGWVRASDFVELMLLGQAKELEHWCNENIGRTPSGKSLGRFLRKYLGGTYDSLVLIKDVRSDGSYYTVMDKDVN